MAAIKTETVAYKHGSAQLEGYLAYDDAVSGKRPGILVVHEWWGLNDFTKQKTEELAKMGYVAFAADIYGKGVRTTDAGEAGKTSAIYKNDRALTRARVDAALKILEKDPRVDKTKLAAIGFCFGGMVALEAARAGEDLKGVVTFHGDLSSPNPADAKNIKGRVLVLHGADDPFVTRQVVDGFISEMNAAKVDWQLNMYSGAVHAFTNPNAGNDPKKGMAYNEKAAERAWAAMGMFFDDIFKTAKR
ncbi:MAG: dienelactone hydrolase family protein [Elusimicrobia bacterium]|nr:dienelactone hydrolase family protein [Elusimicrobiota bacterium]